MKKKDLLIIFLYTIFSLVFQLTDVIAKSCGGEEVNMNKVEKFEYEIGNFIKSNKETWQQDENKMLEIIKSVNLNDSEYIKVQELMSEQTDIRYLASGGIEKANKDNFDDNLRYVIFSIAKGYPIEQWEMTMTKEEIIMKKILPIIENPKLSDKLRTEWMVGLSSILSDIHNQKLPFSESNRIKVMDKLIETFSNKNNSVNMKIFAARGWAIGERRNEKKYEGVDILANEGDVFEKVGRSLISLDRYSSPAPQIYNKVLDILDNGKKYSDKTINGAMDFCNTNTFAKDADIRNRLKKILKRNIEESPELKEKSERILNVIEKNEKRGQHK